MFLSDSWRDAFYTGKGARFKVNPVTESVMAEVVSVQTRQPDKYGDYERGEDEIFIIFKVGETYYKKVGSMDSYGDVVSFAGPCTKVTPRTETATIWE